MHNVFQSNTKICSAIDSISYNFPMVVSFFRSMLDIYRYYVCAEMQPIKLKQNTLVQTYLYSRLLILTMIKQLTGK